MADKWIQLMSEDGTDNLFPTSNMDLLWTNASPTSSFSAQTVSLDLSNYNYIVIDIKCINSSTAYVTIPSQRLLYEKGEYRMTFNHNIFCYRRIVISNSGVEFDVGEKAASYSGGLSNDNSYLIPLRIYGIK